MTKYLDIWILGIIIGFIGLLIAPLTSYNSILTIISLVGVLGSLGGWIIQSEFKILHEIK